MSLTTTGCSVSWSPWSNFGVTFGSRRSARCREYGFTGAPKRPRYPYGCHVLVRIGPPMTQPTLPRPQTAIAQVDDVRDLLSRGQRAGFLTSDEIGAALVAAELPPDATDTVLQILAEHGIEIVDSSADEEDEAPREEDETTRSATGDTVRM